MLPGMPWEGVAYPLVAFVVVFSLLLRRLFGAGAFPNAANTTDAFAHLFRASFVAQEWKDGILFPLWTPGWYLGAPVIQYYPPLMTAVLSPLALAGGISFAYQAFVTVTFAVATVSVVVLFRSRLGNLGALVAGIVYPLSPFVLRTVFAEGLLPAALIVAIQPILLRLILDLVDRPTRKRFALVVATTAAAVLAHPLLAIMFMVSIGAGALMLAAMRPDHRRKVGISFAALAIGIGLTSVWLFSALSAEDFENVPKQQGPETRLSQSRSFEVFDPAQRDRPDVEVYLGLTLVILGLGGVAATWGRDITIVLTGATGVSVFMMFGMNNPAITNLPLLDEFVFFERFLLTTSLALALLAGLLVSWLTALVRTRFGTYSNRASLVLVAALLAILLTDASSHFTGLVRQSDQQIWIDSSRAIASQAKPGRIQDFTGRPEPAFFPSTVGRDAIAGWFPEGTPHWERLALAGDAMAIGHDRFVARQLQQWWATGAYSISTNERVNTALRSAGFVPLEVDDPFSADLLPWARTDDASIANAIKRNSLIVGRATTIAGIVLPWASQAVNGRYGDIAASDFVNNRLFILAEAPPDIPPELESQIEQFRSNGGAIMVVLGGDPGVWKADLNTDRAEFPDAFTVVDASGETVARFEGLFGSAVTWNALFVNDGRAETLLRLEGPNGFNIPLLSKVDEGDGPVYVLGGAFYNLVFNWPQQFSMEPVEEVLARELPALVMEDGLIPLAAVIQEMNSQRLRIQIEVPNEAPPILISTTFAPHWKSATVDGNPIELRDYEGLVSVNLPAGIHTLELRQGITSSYYIGFTLTLLVAAGLAFVLWRPYSLEAMWQLAMTKLPIETGRQKIIYALFGSPESMGVPESALRTHGDPQSSSPDDAENPETAVSSPAPAPAPPPRPRFLPAPEASQDHDVAIQPTVIIPDPVQQTPPASSRTILVRDEYDVDRERLEGHVPLIGLEGATWHEDAGAWRIQGGACFSTSLGPETSPKSPGRTPGRTGSRATIDAGQADVMVQADGIWRAGGIGIVARHDDKANYIAAWFEHGGGTAVGVLKLAVSRDGLLNTIKTAENIDWGEPGTRNTLALTVSGKSITVTLGGVERISMEDVEDLPAGTSVGLFSTGRVQCRFTDFFALRIGPETR